MSHINKKVNSQIKTKKRNLLVNNSNKKSNTDEKY